MFFKNLKKARVAFGHARFLQIFFFSTITVKQWAINMHMTSEVVIWPRPRPRADLENRPRAASIGVKVGNLLKNQEFGQKSLNLALFCPQNVLGTTSKRVCDFGTKFSSFIADLLLNIFGKTRILWKIQRSFPNYLALFSVNPSKKTCPWRKVWKKWGYKSDFRVLLHFFY